MTIVAQTDFRSRVSTKIECTTFKWELPNFRELQEYYDNISSNSFRITNTNTFCTLRLRFVGIIAKSKVSQGTPGYHSYEDTKPKPSPKQDYAIVYLQFADDALQNKVKIILSIINERGSNILSHSKIVGVEEKTITFDMIATKELLCGNVYLHDDTLTLLCKIINVESQGSTITGLTRHTGYLDNNFHRKAQMYFNDKTFCDVMFNVQETFMYAHRLILAAQSSVFEAMFKTDMVEHTERVVDIIDIDVPIFEAFLKYIYTGSVDELPEIGKGLIIVADKYSVQSLLDLCETSLADNLDDANAIELLVLSHRHTFIKLKSQTLAYLRTHQQEIIKTVEFKELCVTYPELVTDIFLDD